VFNGKASDFDGDEFIFVTEDGDIDGWQKTGGAKLRFDGSSAGANYKGAALADFNGKTQLYAADFHNNKIDVFDAGYKKVPNGGFVDSKLPKDYAPFDVYEENGTIYVAYAEQDTDKKDAVKGAGKGFIDAYDTGGALKDRIASNGTLDAPWGLAVTHDGFGKTGDQLIVGNFGDGHIHAYDLGSATNGNPAKDLGEFGDENGKPLVIDGLWALDVPPDAGGFKSSSELAFTAGPGDEKHGLFGKLDGP
jgi:uncharacterized protein (TIGR03118 family)